MAVPAFLHPFSPPSRTPWIRIVRGEGALVWDADGTEYVDGLASLWYCQIGHGRAAMADAVARQMTTLEAFHTFAPFTNGPAEELAELVAARAPMPGARVFLTSSGSEAVDTVLKLVRLVHRMRGQPERHVVIARSSAYHGVTYGGTSAQGIAPNREGFGALVPDVVHVAQHDLDALRVALEANTGRVAAVMTEPLQAAGGVHPPAPGYLEGVRALCDAHGALMVADEVVCGFGRLGAWFGSARYGVVPDLLTFAKGVTSGYLPLGGVVVSRAVCDVLESDGTFLLRHGFTYSGHPTCCAAGIANIGILESEGLLARAPEIGSRLGAGLGSLASEGRVVEARGDGAVWGVTLHAGHDAAVVRDAMLARGVIARPLPGNVIAFCPPLVATDAQVDRCIEALDGALRAQA
jgi:putrescine aminotransferase